MSSTDTVIKGLDTIWELEWAGSGELYITERGGRLSRWDGQEVKTIAELPVVEQGESGLMGMALDPNFASNSYIYLCYTRRDRGQLENAVGKFKVYNDGLAEKNIILKGMGASSIHDGCRLGFDPEGSLLVTMGDASRASLAQDRESLNGKVLRINRDGSIPENNPFPGSPLFTMGHRNPQGLDVRPEVGEIYISEHGPATDDEINRLIPGRNYGWPEVKGTEEVEGFEPALWDWTPTVAPAGIAFTDKETLYMATLKQSKLHRLELDEGGQIASDTVVLEGYGRLRAVTADPEGRCLYVGTSNRDGRGRPGEGDDRVLKFCPS
ncbi:MAG: PQQ-dependent sugar dehydrogenase [Candidatus Bipolaricaulota bacterium]